MADKAKFFYTTNTPHQWSSGPTYHYWNKKYEPIVDLEEAKALAIAAQKGRPGEEGYVETTYGVTYSYDPESEMKEVSG